MIVLVVIPKPPFTTPVVYGPFASTALAKEFGRSQFLRGLTQYVVRVQEPTT